MLVGPLAGVVGVGCLRLIAWARDTLEVAMAEVAKAGSTRGGDSAPSSPSRANSAPPRSLGRLPVRGGQCRRLTRRVSRLAMVRASEGEGRL